MDAKPDIQNRLKSISLPQFWADRSRFRAYVTQRYPTLLNVTYRDISVTERYRTLPNVTDSYWPLLTVTNRYRKLPLLALQALPVYRAF